MVSENMSGGRSAGHVIGVASLMMRGLVTPMPFFVLPACASLKPSVTRLAGCS